MQIPEPIQDVYAATADAVAAYASLVAAGAGATGALVAIYAIRRFAKTREHDDLAATLGVLLFAVVTTEGMWEVVHNKLGVNIPLTIAMFAAFDVVIYSQGRLAIRRLTTNPKARVGTYLAIIWALSIAASLTVSTAGGNITTQLFRFFSPLVAAALWTQKVLELRNGETERAESNWIWTPDRLLVRWGLKKPGAVDDLSDVFAKRRIVALVDAGMELHVQQQAAQLHGDKPAEPARWWRRQTRDPLAVALRRLQQLTKDADAATVAAAREQLRRVLSIETELFRDDTQPTERERELMDDLRRVMTQATTRIRDEHRAAFGPRREPLVELGAIRVPAHLAAQIGPPPEPRPAHRPAHSGGSLEALVDVVGEPRREPITGSRGDSPATAAATHAPTQRRITERLTGGSPGGDDRRIRQAYARLTRRLDREPTGPELAEAAGVSKATANRWKKAQNAPKEKS